MGENSEESLKYGDTPNPSISYRAHKELSEPLEEGLSQEPGQF